MQTWKWNNSYVTENQKSDLRAYTLFLRMKRPWEFREDKKR